MTVSDGQPRRPRALVTGASRGIGRAIAIRLAESGYDLTLTARNPGSLEETASRLPVDQGRVTVYAADLSKPADIDALASFQTDAGDALDVLVLSAGIGSAGPLADSEIWRAKRQLDVNYLGPLQLVQALLPALRKAAAVSATSSAKIIAIASMAGVVSEPGLSGYGASKAALISLCESINVEEADSGVIASAVSPGYVDTDMSGWVRDRIAPERMIAVDDIAQIVLALCRLSRNAVVPNLVVTRPGPALWRA